MVVEYNHVLSANVGEEDFYVPLRPSPLSAGAMSSLTLFGDEEMEVGVDPRGLDTVNRLRQQRSSPGKTGLGCNLMLRASMPGRGGLRRGTWQRLHGLRRADVQRPVVSGEGLGSGPVVFGEGLGSGLRRGAVSSKGQSSVLLVNAGFFVFFANFRFFQFGLASGAWSTSANLLFQVGPYCKISINS
jgi:hypothetical protein